MPSPPSPPSPPASPNPPPDAGAQPAQSPEGELVARARAGDQLAISQLLANHQHRLYAVCLRMLGTTPHDRQTATDLTQDALVKIIQGLPQFDAQSQFSTWAIRITMNVVLSYLRSQAVRRGGSVAGTATRTQDDVNARFSTQINPRSRQYDEYRPGDPRHSDASSPAPEHSGLSSVQHQELRAGIADALAKLPVDHRSILILRDIRGLEYDQIALVLNLEPGTVKSRLFRARLALRTALESTHDADGTSPA